MSLRVSTLLMALGLASIAQAQKTVLPLWPHGTPEPPLTSAPEVDVTRPATPSPDYHSAHIANVSNPTLSLYPAPHPNGAAALVFPGGGYVRLSFNSEGTDTCDWLNSLGVTCILVKYRVPQPTGDAGHYPTDFADLEDAQQAMRITRAHAIEWHIDPTRIGVVGFSAGGNLAALLNTHPKDNHVASTPAASEVDANIDASPQFAILVYPAYLTIEPDQRELDPAYTPTAATAPTFLTAAENDIHYGKNSLVYYRALLDANIPAELHMFAAGGHGFGMHPKGDTGEWSALAATWLRSIGMIPMLPTAKADSGPTTGAPINPAPCTIVSQPPQPGRPDKPAQPDQPNCF